MTSTLTSNDIENDRCPRCGVLLAKLDEIGGIARIRELEAERHELMDALENSVALQSHYAGLLNMHDGGKRIVFKSADEWLERRRSLAKRMQTPVPASP